MDKDQTTTLGTMCPSLGNNLAKMTKRGIITILQKGSYPKKTNRAYTYHMRRTGVYY